MLIAIYNHVKLLDERRGHFEVLKGCISNAQND